MTKASAAAQPAANTGTACHLWQAPPRPLSIRLSLDVVDRLEREVVETFRAVTRRGSEIGGLLLGRAQWPVTAIEDFELIPCDYSRGPLYLLSEADEARLAGAVQRRSSAAGEGLAVVGFFRSNTRPNLALDEEDLVRFQTWFRKREQVYLLIKPLAGKSNIGGFFIWEDGQIRGAVSPREFPFHRAALLEETAALPAREEARAPVVQIPARKEEPVFTEPPFPRAEERAPVLPFAPKREEPQPPGNSGVSFEYRQARPLFPQIAKPAGEPKPEAPQAVEKESEPAVEQAETAAAQPPEPDPDTAEAPPAAKKSRRWIGALGLLFLGVGGGLALWMRSRPAPAPSALVSREESTPVLRVDRGSGQFLVSWNREAGFVKTARRAVLYISDGATTEGVDLDLNQLRSGSVVYSAITADVTFRLEVTGTDGRKVASDYVRVLSASAGPPPPETLKGAGPEAQPTAAPGSADPQAPPAARMMPTKPFSLAERVSQPPEDPNLPEPPGLEPASEIALARPVVSGTISLPAPPVREAAKPATPAAPPVKIGGDVRAPQLVQRTEPVYPPMARNARIGGVVRVQASIGKDGRVQSVNVLSGHPLLRTAARDAVQQWVYQPSLLNGQPVESVTQVDVNFNLAGR